MLNRVRDEIRDCLDRAEECRQRAGRHGHNDERRKFWMDQEQRWQRLANSYDLQSRTQAYLDKNKKNGKELKSAKERQAGE